MDILIKPRLLSGTVKAIPSKSLAHRILICAAFSDSPTEVICPETSRDMEATADCLRALSADIERCDSGYRITPVSVLPESAVLSCGESGSTLRFLLPVAGALGVETTFLLEGRLPDRPLSPLWEEMERMGCILSRPTPDTVLCRGQLKPGAYRISGGVSSQFITGLLLALNLLPEESTLNITGEIQSKPYLAVTKQVLSLFGADAEHPGRKPYRSPGQLTVEGDWSNAAFFLAARVLGSSVNITGLSKNSVQGDRAVCRLLDELADGFSKIDAKDIPDLVPVLAVAAGANHGAVFTNIERLRLKESDRVAAVIAMIQDLGGKAESDAHTLTIEGTGFEGGTVDACRDHRIAMAAAIASTVCRKPVVILGAEAVNKSYPGFFQDFCRLGGNYEQYLR